MVRHELNKKDISRSVRLDQEEIMRIQCYTQNYVQLLNPESRRINSSLLGRAHQWAIQYGMVIPENSHMSSIMQTEQMIFRNIYVSAFMHKRTINERKEYIHLKGSKRSIWRGEREEREGRSDVIIL